METLENHEAEKEILRVVCSEFATSFKSTPRKPLLVKNSRNLHILEELERWNLLRRIGVGDIQEQFLPTLGAFCLCGDEKVIGTRKGRCTSRRSWREAIV